MISGVMDYFDNYLRNKFCKLHVPQLSKRLIVYSGRFRGEAI